LTGYGIDSNDSYEEEGIGHISIRSRIHHCLPKFILKGL